MENKTTKYYIPKVGDDVQTPSGIEGTVVQAHADYAVVLYVDENGEDQIDIVNHNEWTEINVEGVIKPTYAPSVISSKTNTGKTVVDSVNYNRKHDPIGYIKSLFISIFGTLFCYLFCGLAYMFYMLVFSYSMMFSWFWVVVVYTFVPTLIFLGVAASGVWMKYVSRNIVGRVLSAAAAMYMAYFSISVLWGIDVDTTKSFVVKIIGTIILSFAYGSITLIAITAESKAKTA